MGIICHQICVSFLTDYLIRFVNLYTNKFHIQLLKISLTQVRLLVGVLKSVGAGDLTDPDGMFLCKTFNVSR